VTEKSKLRYFGVKNLFFSSMLVQKQLINILKILKNQFIKPKFKMALKHKIKSRKNSLSTLIYFFKKYESLTRP